ncbi:MAG: hypothetical protein KZQ66_17170 [Candidatus Thiodiazotropha sp. (ex Lucinoma aequizonata)]|nr:hypothetical protein [Candidatus Thiodiazotropha sp. (ex Lucinoma aequizonata)]MCU7903503.1 hypothetical protein [Candidatus Thiodiazotropha sp. (ex Lucinoma aequizonata)]MCU7910375.1 hypothetical protein [Candidatus Thiodiazotropha sp. (ex Lucinoma aequizonata)]MCU7913479.1 hypothetical protein [Candidatus Thiodiazotropha sp. (ex Lucinoma aequizonata)]
MLSAGLLNRFATTDTCQGHTPTGDYPPRASLFHGGQRRKVGLKKREE